MGSWEDETLTDQQRRWFASVREGLERETGRSLDDWAGLARACPETRARARLAWMKTTYGLGQNRASMILNRAFPPTPAAAQDTHDPLWADPAAQAMFDAVRTAVAVLEGVLIGRRKAYTAFSRRHQFAAVRPLAAGGVKLGLALTADPSLRLIASERREPWSERLTAVVDLESLDAVDADVRNLLQQAWARS